MKNGIFLLFLIVSSLSVKAQWVDLGTSIVGELRTVHFNHVDTGMVGGVTGIYKTVDGGLNWIKQYILGNPLDSVIMESSVINDIFEDRGFWYAVGKDTVNGNAVVFRTSYTLPWEISYSVVGTGFNSLTARGAQTVVVGDGGNAAHSSNDGGTWLPLATGVTSDLNSISTFTTGYAYVGGDSVILRSVSAFDFSLGFSVVTQKEVSSIYMNSNNAAFAVSNSEICSGTFSTWNTQTAYNGLLQGSGVTFATSTIAFVSTANGILKSPLISQGYWERSPSAAGYDLNDIDFVFNMGVGYAVGINGIVLKTTNYGLSTLPYISFSGGNGGCLDSLVSFNNYGPSGYTYSWNKDGTPFASTYNSSTTISTLGLHTVTLIADNGQLIDSLQRNFQIVNVPDSTKAISVVSPLLCKIGNSDVIVQNSELNVVYELIQISTGSTVSYANGNGGNAVLNTGTILDSTLYLVRAKSTFADCETYLLDTVSIGLEKTKAEFHPTLINADLMENIQFKNNSSQASIFSWSFGAGATIPTSTNFEELIAYNQLGQTTVMLIAESAFGCKDTIIKNASFIYDGNTIIENCWSLNFDGNDLATYEHDRGEGIKVANNGDIIVSGSYSEAEFLTKAGITTGRQMDIGFYIARYSTDGALKWLVKGIDQNPGSFYPALWNYSFNGSALDIAIDSDDNIYVTGWLDMDFLLYSNDGKVIPFDFYQEGYVMKLDSNGIYKWHTGMHAALGTAIDIDDSNNIYIGGRYHHTATFFSLSGSSIQMGSNSVGLTFIMKLDSIGEIQWVTDFSNSTNNYYYHMSDLAADADGDVYIIGQHSSPITFNSVSGPNITASASPGSNPNAYVVKYNSAGDAQWGHTIESSPFGFDDALSIEVSDDGDSYIGLNVSAYNTGHSVKFPSTQISDSFLEAGGYVLAKYTTDGNYDWGVGAKYAIGSRAHAVALDKFNNVYVVGILSVFGPPIANFISTDSTVLTAPAGGGSFFVTKYNEFGKIQWLTLEGGPTAVNNGIGANTMQNAIDADDQQNVFITGHIQRGNGITQGYYIAQDSIYPNNSDAFVAKYSSSACLQGDSLSIYVSSGLVCVQDSIWVPFNVSQLITVQLGNNYQLELSDALGSFASPQIIGTLASNNIVDTILGIIPNLLVSGNYKIRVVASLPSIIGNESSIYIDVLPTPLNIYQNLCVGQSTQFIANQGLSYLWSPTIGLNDSTIQNPTTNAVTNTIYTVGVSSFCGVINDTFNLTVNPLPNVSITSFSPDSVCIDTNLILLPLATPSGGTYSGSGVSGASFNPSIAGPGNQEVIYTVIDSNLCENSDTTTITVNALPNVTITPFSPDSVCQFNIPMALTNGSPVGGVYSGFGVSSSVFNPSLIPGNYYVLYTYTDTNSCVNSDSTMISLYICVGIDEYGEDLKIVYYPNPTTGGLTIEKPSSLMKDVQVKILDATSKLIIEKEIPVGKKKVEIDITNYSDGIYYLQLIIEEEVFVKQILKH